MIKRILLELRFGFVSICMMWKICFVNICFGIDEKEKSATFILLATWMQSTDQ
jgi:hypothetical protein